MKCPKCNSENVQVQSKEYKPKFTVPILLTFGGFGLMLGPLGLIIGVIVGGIVAAIVKSMLPQTYQPVVVCQQCGFVGTETAMLHNIPNPLFSSAENSNLWVVRKANMTGAVCAIKVTIDNECPFELNNGDVKYLKLEHGTHKISYGQTNGLGKKERSGSVDITVDESVKLVEFEFIPHGVNVVVK